MWPWFDTFQLQRLFPGHPSVKRIFKSFPNRFSGAIPDSNELFDTFQDNRDNDGQHNETTGGIDAARQRRIFR
jgi:hypothetical protein